MKKLLGKIFYAVTAVTGLALGIVAVLVSRKALPKVIATCKEKMGQSLEQNKPAPKKPAAKKTAKAKPKRKSRRKK